MESWANYVGREVANRYRLDSLLGVGSFGAVYAARDRNTQQAVALRLLMPELGSHTAFDPTVLTDFRHPQAIGVSDVGGFEETRYVVMPRTSGTRIQVCDPWPVERILEFVRQVSAPLIAFHKHFDLQHLHLHPGNVFVEEVAGKQRFQLTDLGLASQVGAGPLILEAIREGRTTPEFLSPEQLQGHVPSSQSDVYAFGAMLFQLFAGLPPFPYRGESIASYALHVAKTPPPRFRDVSDQLNVDSYLESIILRCLSKNPDGRPGSIRDLVEAYELAYRDFQTRTLSGLKLAELEQAQGKDVDRSSLGSTSAGESPAQPSSPPSSGGPAANPQIATPKTELPASDMLPNQSQAPDRNTQIPYRALPHGTDTMVEMLKSAGASRAILQESQAILQTVNPQLNPWAGMGSEPARGTPSSPAARSAPQPVVSPEPSRSVAPVPQNPASSASSMGTLSPGSSEAPVSSGHSSRWESPATPQRATEPPPIRESGWPSSPPLDSRGPHGADQTMSPSSVAAPPSSSSGFGGPHEANLTMQLQQDWLRSQMPTSVPRSVAPSAPVRPRSNSRSSGPPKAVLLLAAALAVTAGGLLFYGKSVERRVREEVKALVGKSQYQDAKKAIQKIHPLATIWLKRDQEVQQLLTDGLERVEQLQKERKVAKAIELTGQLELAFAEEESLTDTDQPRRIRQKIAQDLQNEIVRLAGQKQLVVALEEVGGDQALAFQKVQKKLESETSDFNIRATKKLIVQEGLTLSSDLISRKDRTAAFAVLDLWLKKLGNDDDLTPDDKQELRARHCEARVGKTLSDANEEARPGRERFSEALGLLDQLLQELGNGPCSRRRPDVLFARGEIGFKFALATTDSALEASKRFEDSWKDYTAALDELSMRSEDAATTREPTKSTVLKSRAAMLLTRGRWQESRVSAESPTLPLLTAIRDYKNALVDDSNLEEARGRLVAIRENAQTTAHDALQAARRETNRARADELYCDAERQLTIVIESGLNDNDDALAQYARLLRGIARSSLRDRDYVNAIDDFIKAISQGTEFRSAEIGNRLLPETDSQERNFQLNYLLAVGRSRLAWIVATCPVDDIRNEAKTKVKAQEQARAAEAFFEGLLDEVDTGKLKLNDDTRDALFHDACYARKAVAVAWADLGQFDKAQLLIETLQGKLDPNAKGWQSDERESLTRLLENYIAKKMAFREMASSGTAGPCLKK